MIPVTETPTNKNDRLCLTSLRRIAGTYFLP